MRVLERKGLSLSFALIFFRAQMCYLLFIIFKVSCSHILRSFWIFHCQKDHRESAIKIDKDMLKEPLIYSFIMLFISVFALVGTVNMLTGTRQRSCWGGRWDSASKQTLVGEWNSDIEFCHWKKRPERKRRKIGHKTFLFIKVVLPLKNVGCTETIPSFWFFFFLLLSVFFQCHWFSISILPPFWCRVEGFKGRGK